MPCRVDAAVKKVAGGRCDYPFMAMLLAKVIVEYCRVNRCSFDDWKPELQPMTPDFDDIIDLVEDIYKEAKTIVDDVMKWLERGELMNV